MVEEAPSIAHPNRVESSAHFHCKVLLVSLQPWEAEHKLPSIVSALHDEARNHLLTRGHLVLEVYEMAA